MDNKKLGIMMIVICILLAVILFSFKLELDQGNKAACECSLKGLDSCPMEDGFSWPVYGGIIMISILIALGIYLIFFEKSQKEIISTLERQKRIQTEEEKFKILLKGLNNEERKIIKAIKEQDGITQQTLRLRTDMHKSKLSIVLDGLEKKGLIKRVSKGKTKKVFLKIRL
jgi:DNA-binding MarR family transcriptional regulator